MKNTEQIENALRLLREADADLSAPPVLETRLRAAFREQHAPPKKAPWWAAYRLWSSVALASLITGAVVYRVAAPGTVQAPVQERPAVATTAPPARTTAPTADVQQQPAPTTVAAAPAPRPTRRTSPVIRQMPVDAFTASSKQTEEFLAIPYAPPFTSSDRGEVIRVQIPRQSLRSMGIPVNPERFGERVPADLLVGEDGVPRGIRFIRVNEGR